MFEDAHKIYIYIYLSDYDVNAFLSACSNFASQLLTPLSVCIDNDVRYDYDLDLILIVEKFFRLFF